MVRSRWLIRKHAITSISVAVMALMVVVIQTGIRHRLVATTDEAAYAGLGLLVLALLAEGGLAVRREIAGRRQAEELLKEHKQAEELLKEQTRLASERLNRQKEIVQLVLRMVGDAVILMDGNQKIPVFNQAARRMFRIEAGTFSEEGLPQSGLYWSDMVTPFSPEQLPWARSLQGDIVEDLEAFVGPTNGTNGAWTIINGRPLKDLAGRAPGAVVVCRDVTESRQAKEVDRTKSEFLSRMSHELRTPLNSILGFAQLLERNYLTPEEHLSVGQILKAGRHLVQLIDEVLDIARIEAGRLAQSPEPVSVRDAAEEVIDLIWPLAAKRKVSVRSDVPQSCTWHVLADRQRLIQVLLNLLSNAVKYNHHRGEVNVLCQEAAAGWLRIKIHDTGPGIPPDALPRLFTPFERLGAEQTGIEGTGLGLALSKRLVEAMRGKMGVDSAVGQGSTFWLDLPVAEAPTLRPEEGVKAVARSAWAEARGEGRTILYIEDNPSNLRLMEQILAYRPEIKLLSAMQGQLGLDLAREHHPSLILLDLHLSDIPGDEVLRKLRQDPRTSDIPEIVISADATPGQVQRLLSAGACAYLTKPINVNQFFEVVDNILRN